MTRSELWLRLSFVTGMRRSALILHGMAMCAETFTPYVLEERGFTPAQQAQFAKLTEAEWRMTQAWLEKKHHTLLTPQDSQYPTLLRTISGMPLVLFIHGDASLLASPQVAIVGSRHCSHYGRQWGEYFAQELAISGLTITSGLAMGIDGIAHAAALSVQGKTLAVLGCGLDQMYPARHRELASQIVASGGALISEFPLGMPPLSINFPRRNRIISGLSQGVLVIEASMKSGSLVTARYALEQNRDLYALPGALGNPCSEGTHWLIQQGALLVSHPKDILEQVRSDFNWIRSDTAVENIYAIEGDVPLPFVDVLANVGDEVTPVDVVAERAGQPVPVITAKLLELELAGWIAAVPGGYVRLRRACHVRRTNVFV
ncbi:DNA-protecting protein DprA [Enterobacterales bacterium CwR94]|nr:DNA-protecting protein DprA [Enterobacterales bacterium CwR94]